MTNLGWLRRKAVLLAMTAFVAGCTSPKEKVEQSARTAASWSATAQRTSQALALDAVPRVYARQVLRAAVESRRRLALQPEWRSLPASTRGRLEDAIRELASSLNEPVDSLPLP